MRKRTLICLAAALCLLLCACGKAPAALTPAPTPAPAPVSTEAPAPTPAPAETEAPAPTAAPSVGQDLSQAEQEFAGLLTEQLLADGYEALTPADYPGRCRQALLCPDALPESYRSTGLIYLKPDPKVSSQTMVTQLWFDAASREYLQFTQEDSELWVEESLRYQEREDAAEGGFNYRGMYKVRANDLAVTGVLYLSEDKGEDYCRGILTAIHFESK